MKTRQRPQPKTGQELGLTRSLRSPQQAPIKIPVARLNQSAKPIAGDLAGYLPSDWFIFKPPLHSSAVKDWVKCPRLFLYQVILGLKRKGHYRPALETGRLFHRALEYLSIGKSTFEETQKVMLLALEEQITNLESQTNRFGLFPDGTSHFELAKQAREDFWKALAMASVYWDACPLNKDKYKVLGVEVEIEAKVHGIGRRVKGILDLVTQDRSTGEVWIDDYKTSGSSDLRQQVAALSFDISPQIYRLLAMTKWPDLPIMGMVHRFIRKPGIKYCPDTIDKKGFSHYVKRVEEWYLKEEEAWKVQGPDGPKGPPWLTSHIRFQGRRPPPDLFGHVKAAGTALGRRIELAKFPRCGSSFTCIGFGGKGACEFLELCRHEHPKRWATLLAAGNGGIYVQDHRDDPIPKGGAEGATPC